MNPKYNIVILVFSLFIGISGFSQEMDLSKEEITEKISKTWMVSGVNEKAKKFGLGEMKFQRYIFTKENRFRQLNEEDENPSKGEWKFDPQENVIYLSVRGRSFAKIIALTEKEMTLTSSGYPEAEIYCKAAEE